MDEHKTKAVPLAQEEVRVDKRQVPTGKVRVRTVAETIEEVIRDTLEDEQVEITRVPINQVISATPSIRTENDVVIIPVVEEVLVVERRLVLTEEVQIRRHLAQQAVEVPLSLTKQRAVVERLAADGQPVSQEEHQ